MSEFGPTETTIRNLIVPLGIASPTLTTVQLVRTLVSNYLEVIKGSTPNTPIMDSLVFAGRVPKTDAQLLADAKQEKNDALRVMLDALPAHLSHLRDGTMGNVVRYYVAEARRVNRLQNDNDDKNEQIIRLNRQVEAAERSLVEMKPASVAETDAEAPEVTDVPDAFVRLSTAALDRFAEGYAEYGPGAADALGIAGQWGDLHRKVMKLKASMWAGKGRLTRETEEDILYDIVGHCLLALEMYSRDFTGGRD